MKKRRSFAAAIVLMLAVALFSRLSAWADAAGYDFTFSEVDFDVVVAAADGSGYLYLRYGPGTGYDIICSIYDGTVLHITLTAKAPDKDTIWGQTEYNGHYGWVSLTHTKEYRPVTPTEPVPQAVSYDVAVQAADKTDYLYLRTGPGMNYDVICYVYNGEKLHISAEIMAAGGGFNWGQTEYQGFYGWVSLKHVVDYAKYLAEHPTTAAPTDPPTEAPTEPPTEAPTEPPTEAPTEPPTEVPTEPLTEAPTEAPTQPATQAPTQAPTQPATQAPTQPPTQPAPTAPTVPVTKAQVPNGNDVMMERNTQSKLIILIAAGVAVVGGGVAALIVILSKNKKKNSNQNDYNNQYRRY